jgi:predicted PurR-regulated permease PerM
MITPERPYTFDRVVRMILSAMVMIGIIWLITRLSHVLGPFIIAVFIAYLLNPFVSLLQRKLHFGRGLASSVAILIIVSLVVGVLWLLIPLVLEEMTRMAYLIKQYIVKANYRDILPGPIEEKIKEFFEEYSLADYFQLNSLTKVSEKVLPQVWRFFSGSISIIFGAVGALIVLLYTLFILLDFEKMGHSWPELVPSKQRTLVVAIANDLRDAMQLYFRSQGLIAFIVGILFAIGFKIIGLPLPIIMGLFIGLLNMVPYLQIVGLVPALLLALLKAMETHQSFWHMALLVFIVLAIVQTIQEVILTPRIMGKAYGLNPAIVLLSLSIWGSLMGLIGMLLALPLTTLIYSYYKRFILQDHQIVSPDENIDKPQIS